MERRLRAEDLYSRVTVGTTLVLPSANTCGVAIVAEALNRAQEPRKLLALNTQA
jgi:hypothetical protein